MCLSDDSQRFLRPTAVDREVYVVSLESLLEQGHIRGCSFCCCSFLMKTSPHGLGSFSSTSDEFQSITWCAKKRFLIQSLSSFGKTNKQTKKHPTKQWCLRRSRRGFFSFWGFFEGERSCTCLLSTASMTETNISSFTIIIADNVCPC